MKKLYIHIGCGKTGSSALQIWLNDNIKLLKKEGIHYPLFNLDNKIHSYAITSGNGTYVLEKIKNNKIREVLNEIFSSDNDIALISSEMFQILSQQNLIKLKRESESLGISIEIIAYVRDLYDMEYSTYQQSVKRHMYTGTFYEFVYNKDSILQFQAINNYESIFGILKVIHYDSAKINGLEKSFCLKLGIDPNKLSPMNDNKVNRSLSLHETEILRYANRIYKETCNKINENFSSMISDVFIYQNPEKETDILYDDRIFNFLSDKYKRDINIINNKYFKEKKLNIINKNEKKLVTNIPSVDSDLKMTIQGMLNYFRHIHMKDAKKIDIIELLVNQANSRKNKKEALAIIKTAQILRPHGKKLKMIRKRLAESI